MRARLALILAALLVVGPIGCGGGGGDSFSGNTGTTTSGGTGSTGGSGTTGTGSTGSGSSGTADTTIQSIALTTGASDVVADPANSVTVRATVKNASTGLSGQTVTFSTTGGTLSATSATTNASGFAEVTLTAPKTTGQATITASTGGFLTTTTVAFNAGPATTVTASAAPTTVRPAGTTTITVRVLDANKNPVSDEQVGFSITTNNSGGSFEAKAATTDINGEATVTYTAGTSLGTDTLQVRTLSNGASASVNLVVSSVAAIVGSLELVSGSSSLVADKASSTLLRARVLDTDNKPVSGSSITFTTTAGEFKNATATPPTTIDVTTNSDGYAEVTLVSSSNTGTAKVIATASGFQKNVDVEFVAGAASEIMLYVSPTTVEPLGVLNISAAVNDKNKNRISGERLAFRLFDDATPDKIINSWEDVTDASGVLSGTFNVLIDTNATLTLKAYLVNSNITAEEIITVSSAAVTAASLTLTTGDDAIVADGSSKTVVRATLKDTAGKPIPNVTVKFSNSAGTLMLADGTTVADSATTNSLGVAELYLKAPTTTGTAVVGASYAGFNPTTQVTFKAGVPKTIALSPDVTVAPGADTTFTATVTDEEGNAVSGETVVFEVTTNVSGGSLGAVTATTNASGVASATYTAGSTLGVDIIRARATTVTTVSKTISVTVASDGVVVGSVVLLGSSPQLSTSSSGSVTLTAIVKDANNIVLSGVDVSFSATSGDLTVTQGATDASGIAKAELRSTSDVSIRSITVTATAGGKSATFGVTTAGTQITASGEKSVVLTSTTQVTFTLKDADGNGIAYQALNVVSAKGNTLTPSGGTFQTNSNGQLVVTVTPVIAGADTVTATGLGASVNFALSVSASDFTMAAPAEIDVSAGTCAAITATWLEGAVPQALQALTFSTTRGALYTDALCTVTGSTATTNGSGVATMYLTSTDVGPVTLTASAAGGAPTASASSEFVASTPSTISIQATTTTIGTLDSTTLTAIVRDANNNRVKNADIRFRIVQDNTGGSVFPASDTTDSLGRASTVYSSTDAASAKNGVVVEASVVGFPAVTAQIQLTVAQQGLAIAIGLANQLTAETSATYAYPGVVHVIDSAGNPVSGAQITLSVIPRSYYKGERAWDSAKKVWNAVDKGAGACTNEDLLTGDQLKDLNGILDAGEDFNGNGTLESGNVATVERNVTTNANGYATFNIRYAKDYADWVDVELIATATVGGSESVKTTSFNLVALAADVSTETSSPPGLTSPFGKAIVCSNPL